MTPALRAVARRQAGCLTRGQALRCGLTPADIQRRLLDGDWLHVMRDVYVVAGAPVTEAMKAWTAVLAVGMPVAVAGCSGGRVLGLDQVPMPDRPTLVVPGWRDPMELPGVDIRRVVPARWALVWRDGLPVTPVAPTIRDVAGEVPIGVARDVVQHALRRRRTSFAALSSTLGRGLSGSAALRQILEEVGPGFQVMWERRFHRALLAVGVRMQPQVKVVAPDGRTAYLDLGLRELRFGVEIDGFLNHMARFAADRRRGRMLAVELGWTIAHYAVEELAADLAGAAREVAAHVAALRRAA